MTALTNHAEGRSRIANIIGTQFGEILVGTLGLDTILGLGGNDSIFGDARFIAGEAGQPTEVTGDDDVIDGGLGDDTIYGDAAFDGQFGVSFTLVGGDDRISGGAGNDALYGDGSSLSPLQACGNDFLDGGIGNDVMYGDGNTPFGLRGSDDILVGGAGDDTIYGDGTSYSVTGGNDRVLGGVGVNTLYGDGVSRYNLTGGDDQLVGGGILYGDGSATSGFSGMAGTLTGGDDALIGALGNDTLYGDGIANGGIDGGDDSLSGLAGGDTLYGDGTSGLASLSRELVGGDDTLRGGVGNDTLYGEGTGRIIVGGDDIVDGGGGNDVLWGEGTLLGGGFPASTIIGGADTFEFARFDGLDTIMDFRRADGDHIVFRATGLSWSKLDSNGSGALDDGDAYVSVAGTDTQIDYGRAGGASLAGRNVLTMAAVTGLIETDFVLI